MKIFDPRVFATCFFACGLFAGAGLFCLPTAYGAAPAGVSGASVQPVLASHKALYAVTLTSTRPGSDYLDVNGKMLLEFTDACDVWTTNQKSILHTVTGEGAEEVSNSDFNAVESKSGDSYVFNVRQTQNGEVSEFRGRAKRNRGDDSGTAFYTKPERKSYKLPPNFLFQTAQQVRLIEYAQKGGRFLNGDMFDGSEGGGAARFNALVLKPTVSVSSAATLKSPLLDSPEHRLRVAFYPPQGLSDGDAAANSQDDDNSGEQPEYEMTMTVHDNGVVSDYDYDYQDFSVHGALISIQALPRPHC